MHAPADPRHLSTPPARRTERILLTTRGLRAVGDGCVSIVLPLHLTALGFTPLAVGVLATATLLGSGVLALAVGLYASRWPQRTLLLWAAALMAATGVAFASIDTFGPLLLVAVVGTLNPSSGDVSMFLPVEQAALSGVAEGARRTSVFARYSLVGALCGAVGALLAGAPQLIVEHWQVPLLQATRAMFLGYAALALLAAIQYRGLPVQQRPLAPATPAAIRPLGRSRRIVYELAALFSLDAFAGGFLVQSLLALWLFERFALAPTTAAALFFWTGLLSAASYLVAARIAQRIGLVRTMVFTHLPSSVFLLLLPFVSSLPVVMALLLARSALSQMDVPTRTSYVMAIVDPAERPAAASITSVPRSLAAAASPAIAGYLLATFTFAWPLFIAGTLKIAYDLLLLRRFGGVRPIEETTSATPHEQRDEHQRGEEHGLRQHQRDGTPPEARKLLE